MSMYIVTERRKMDKGRVGVVLNESVSFWLYSKEAAELSIEEGAELTEEQYGHILHCVIGKRAIRRAMHLLERQERTERQLRDKLARNEYPEEAIEDALSYVRKYRYLDDERYARNFIRFHQEGRGRTRLASDLARRGVPKDVIGRCLEEEFEADEKEQIRRLLDKKRFSPDSSDQKEQRRICQYLLRRGFRSSDIRAVMGGEYNKDLT